MGRFFQNLQNFCVFAMRTPENFEKWAYMSRKSLKMGTFLCQNDSKKWVWVSRLERHIPVQTKSEYPPGQKQQKLQLYRVLKCDVIKFSFFCIWAFSWPYFSSTWWKTLTHQIWHELVHGGPRYGRMNT